MNFEQFERDFEKFQENFGHGAENTEYQASQEELEQVIEKDAYGEERDEDVNVWISDDGNVSVYGRDTEQGIMGKRPEEFRQAEKVLQENAHGEKVNDVEVVQDYLGVSVIGDDVEPTGARKVLEEATESGNSYGDSLGENIEPAENYNEGNSEITNALSQMK